MKIIIYDSREGSIYKDKNNIILYTHNFLYSESTMFLALGLPSLKTCKSVKEVLVVLQKALGRLKKAPGHFLYYENSNIIKYFLKTLLYINHACVRNLNKKLKIED